MNILECFCIFLYVTLKWNSISICLWTIYIFDLNSAPCLKLNQKLCKIHLFYLSRRLSQTICYVCNIHRYILILIIPGNFKVSVYLGQYCPRWAGTLNVPSLQGFPFNLSSISKGKHIISSVCVLCLILLIYIHII